MKKYLLFIGVLITCTQTFAQNSLKQIITGPNGLSKHFVKLEQAQQVNFNPSQAANLFGLDAKSGLELMNSFTDNIGQTHYRYYQTYKGIPIENTMYIVHTVNSKLTGMSGVVVMKFNAEMESRSLAKPMNLQSAINAAIKFAGAKKYAWNDETMLARLKYADKKSDYLPTAKLVWYNTGEQVSAPDLHLAYKIDIYATQPLSRAYYFIDATTGEFLGKKDEMEYTDATGTANTQYSGSKTIHSDLNGSTYRLWDLSRGNGVVTLHGDVLTNLDYTSTSKNWNLTGQGQHAMDVHYGVEQTYDYYKTTFNRNSVDNNGIALISYVNDGEKDNAHWDGTSMNFGIRSANSKGVTGIDVTGHELTHGVTQYTSNLNYSNESGAMNESMSDIMGKSVQFFAKTTDINWQLSNDMGWIIRDMAHPNAYDQPDTYLGTDWYTGTDDNGGVHTNSGVGNYMFYLLVNGGTGTNDNGDAYSVTGIGLAKADQIIYRTETVYLTPTSNYKDWRDACVAAATDLYGGSTTTINAVKNAWHAVGVGDYYCFSYGTNTSYFYISKVALSNVSKTSGDNGGYANFTSLVAAVTKRQLYPLTLKASYYGTVYPVYWTVYADYNQDGDFDDANEKIATGPSNTTAAITKYISIPSNAKVGKTIMRVQMSYNGGEGPCGVITDGEVEDYMLNIKSATSFSLTATDEPSLAINSKNKTSIIVSPNPLTGSNATVNYSLAGSGQTTLKIVDVYGRSLQSTTLGFKNQGSYTIPLSFVKKLPAGTYVLILEQDGKEIGQTKMVVASDR